MIKTLLQNALDDIKKSLSLSPTLYDKLDTEDSFKILAKNKSFITIKKDFN